MTETQPDLCEMFLLSSEKVDPNSYINYSLNFEANTMSENHSVEI